MEEFCQKLLTLMLTPLNSSKILTLPGTACFQLGRLEPTKNSGWLFQGFTCPLQAGLIMFHRFVEVLSSRIIEIKENQNLAFYFPNINYPENSSIQNRFFRAEFLRTFFFSLPAILCCRACFL